MGGFSASILHFFKNALHYSCIIFASELHQISIMSTCMIVIVCVVYDSKIMAKLMKNARIEFADTANTGSKSERVVENFIRIIQNEIKVTNRKNNNLKKLVSVSSNVECFSVAIFPSIALIFLDLVIINVVQSIY